MRLNQTDLNLFVAFEVIYSERNLTRAAEILCLSQPAVSNALARLRRTFDDPLFIRTNKGMVPTPVADNVIGRVREALSLISNSLTEGAVFQPEVADKTFRINMSDLSAAMILPSLEKTLPYEAPGLRLESYQIPRHDLVRELATGSMDMAVDAPLLNDPQLCHRPLIKQRYVCMVRRGHPLENKELTLEDYLSFGHIHVSSRRRGQGHVDLALLALGHQRHIQLRLQHYMVAPTVVLQSDLLLTAPLGLALQHEAQIFELPFALTELELHLYWHKSRDADQANRWLRERIVENASA